MIHDTGSVLFNTRRSVWRRPILALGRSRVACTPGAAAHEPANRLDGAKGSPFRSWGELWRRKGTGAQGHIQVDVANHHFLEGLFAPAHQLAGIGIVRVLLGI